MSGLDAVEDAGFTSVLRPAATEAELFSIPTCSSSYVPFHFEMQVQDVVCEEVRPSPLPKKPQPVLDDVSSCEELNGNVSDSIIEAAKGKF